MEEAGTRSVGVWRDRVHGRSTNHSVRGCAFGQSSPRTPLYGFPHRTNDRSVRVPPRRCLARITFKPLSRNSMLASLQASPENPRERPGRARLSPRPGTRPSGPSCLRTHSPSPKAVEPTHSRQRSHAGIRPAQHPKTDRGASVVLTDYGMRASAPNGLSERVVRGAVTHPAGFAIGDLCRMCVCSSSSNCGRVVG